MSERSQSDNAGSELEELLLSIDGVESVFIEQAKGSPISTSLRLAEDADEGAVSAAVGAALRLHGLRSRQQIEDDDLVEELVQEEGEVASDAPAPVYETPPPTQRLPVSPARVQTSEITQTPEGLKVSVTLTDGRTGERTVEPGGDQIRMAVVAIVGVLLGVVGARLSQYKVEEFAGRRSVTVIIERGDLGTGIGTAFESGTVFEPGTVELAIARATWAAILG